jgi:hypothetical protein
MKNKDSQLETNNFKYMNKFTKFNEESNDYEPKKILMNKSGLLYIIII